MMFKSVLIFYIDHFIMANKIPVLHPARILAKVLVSAFGYNRDGVQAHQCHGAR